MNDSAPELREYLAVLSKRRRLIVWGTLIAVLGAVVATAYVTPVYEATTTLLLSQRQIVIQDNPSAVETYQAVLLSERLAKTYSKMIEGRTLAQKVGRKLDLEGSIDGVWQGVRAEPVPDTQLVKVTVDYDDPLVAWRVANTIGAVISREVGRLETSGVAGEPLIRVSVVERARRPATPIRPKPVLNVTLAFLIGMAFSAGYAFVLEYLDVTIKHAEDVQQAVDLPVLGQIPALELAKSEADEVVVCSKPKSSTAEAYRALRTGVQYLNFDQRLKVLALTSPGPREGKTTLTANLAAALAQSGARVVALSADLRRPKLHRLFRLDDETGLSNCLAGVAGQDQILKKTSVRGLSVIPSGPVPPNPAELLGSQRMRDLIGTLRDQADYIIVDCPPALAVTDAAVLAPLVDGFLLVASAGETTKGAAKQVKDTLAGLGARLAGVVVNRIDTVHRYQYQYGYYYYYSSEEEKPTPPRGGLTKRVTVTTAIIGGLLLVDAIFGLGMVEAVIRVFS